MRSQFTDLPTSEEPDIKVINKIYLTGNFAESDIYQNMDYTVEGGRQFYYDGVTNKFPMESSVGQIFITDNQDNELKQSCKLELNTGQLTGNSIYDSSGNSNKGLLIGDYRVKKNRKGERMRRDSFIKFPKKKSKLRGAL